MALLKRNSEDLEYKVKFTFYDLEDNLSLENLWAEKEGEYCRIKNIPFFAPNIAYNDLVSVEEEDGDLYFDELIEPSGHSTIQIVIFNLDDVKGITDDIIRLKCDWEGSHNPQYIAVDVPKSIDYNELKRYLEKEAKIGKLDYKEACMAH